MNRKLSLLNCAFLFVIDMSKVKNGMIMLLELF